MCTPISLAMEAHTVTNAQELMKYVLDHEGVGIEELAAHLGVRPRTLRARIARANRLAEGIGRIEFRRSVAGYVTETEDEERLRAWCSPREDTIKPVVPEDANGRVRYLVNDLLSRGGWVTIDDLCSVLFVSRTRISSDLREVEKIIEPFGLTVARRPRYGIRVEGPELARRLCLANLVVEERRDDLASAAISELLDTISGFVEEAVADAGLVINAFAYQNLLVHIAIALVRMREGCYVPMDASSLDQMRNTPELAAARVIAGRIGSELGQELPDEEVAYIAIHLAGKQMIVDALAADDGSTESERLVITDEAWDVVSQMLEVVWDSFRFDFRGDLELRMNLARHVMPLAVRLQHRMKLKNPLLSEVKACYPLAYSLASESSVVLANRYGSAPSEDEIGYIALSFALALERQKEAAPKKNILVVCASGAGSARLLEYRYRREFGNYLNRIVTCNASQVDEIDFSDIDYVFTTVPLGRNLPVPVREVTYFLDEHEIADVRELLAHNSPRDVLSLFDRELFFPHLAEKDKGSVLGRLCDEVAERRTVSPRFSELVWERERRAATSFGNLVAMPHPLEAASEQPIVCVGLLDEAIVWDDFGHEVRAVFLIAVPQEADARTGSLFSALADLFVSRDGIARLVGDQSWETLVELVGEAASGALGQSPDDFGSGAASSAARER